MDNLHRELAPISDAAWQEIEDEARRTFTRDIAGRRVVDVIGPAGFDLSSVGTGHLRTTESPAEGVTARERLAMPIVELRAPFTVTREAVDDVLRGSSDSDWQPVKDAAKSIATAEDRLILRGGTSGITGIGPSSSNEALTLPTDVRDLTDVVAHGVSELRLAGVDGPYNLLLSAAVYTDVAETTDHGYPVRDHLSRLLYDGSIVWAPALEDALLVSSRGGDYELHLGQDLSIGYDSHDGDGIRLYLQETLTFLALTEEASVLFPIG